MAETGTFASLAAADLSVRGIRERTQQREADLVAIGLEARALRAFKRATRAPIGSNERRKIGAKAQALHTLAALIREQPESVERGYVVHPDGGKVVITGQLQANVGRGHVQLGRVA